VLTIGATGEAREKSIYENARAYDFADLKGDLEAVGELAGGLRWEHGGPDFLNAAKRASVFLGKESIGEAGQLARRVADKFKLRQDIFLAELNLDPVYSMYYSTKNARRYEPLPRFPAVERDFSLLLPDGTQFSDVTKAIQSLNIAEISSIEAADLFRGKNVPAGKYSLLIRALFQSREATLTDAQITDFCAKIVTTLKTQLGAQLRAS
jgi:phenylalanyl-tRNA synthetase beta chain